MRNFSNYIKFVLPIFVIFIVGCEKDDDHDDHAHDHNVVAPETYEFTRNGSSTVSFSGQTTRLSQSDELYGEFNSSAATVESLTLMFAGDANGSAGFSETSLNGTTKLIRDKTSASTLRGSAVTQSMFDAWISEYVNDVVPNLASDASEGQAGLWGGKYQFNSKGHEIDQLFFKGLIGAFNLDQIVNNYIHPNQLDSGDRISNNDNGVLSDGKNYTDMEHKWDEGFGYLYGHVIDGVGEELSTAGTTPSGNGNLLMKYFKKTNEKDAYAGIAATVYDAFKLGRAAIVAKDYDLRDEQAKIIKINLSKAVGVYALHYLSGAIATLSDSSSDKRDAFHGLSEGYGFVYSLRFTRNTSTNAPHLPSAEITAFLSTLMEGNGFWDVTGATLDQISDRIASAYGFTKEETVN